MSIRFSQRVQHLRASATVSITQRAIELRESGRDVIALSAGEPDADTPEHIKAAAIEAIRNGDTKYTAVDGTSALKRAIAQKFAVDNGLEFEPKQIVVTSGAKQACFNTCQALLDHGDEALIAAPYWVSYPDMVRLAGAEPVIIRTTAQEAFVPTAQKLAAAITDRTRLLILNSPNNPSGAVYSRSALEELAAVLLEHPRIFILSDDIYEHICWSPDGFATMAAVAPELADRTITVNGLSKSHAMSGWRVGYAAGHVDIIRALTRLQSQSTTNACSVSQAAACAGLLGDRQLLKQMNETFVRRHSDIHAGLNDIPGISCTPGSGAFYLLPDISEAIEGLGLHDDVEFCESLLESQGLALVPGSAFGAPGHLRISFAAADDVLQDALNRLRTFVAC